MASIQNLAARAEQVGKTLEDYSNDLTRTLQEVSTANISVDPLGDALRAGATAATSAVNNLTSNIGANINNAVSGAINNAVGGLFSGAAGGLLGGLGGSFSKENILSKYASYNAIFTFGALSVNEVNFPDSTYRAMGPSIVVLRSGGAGSKQIRTQVEKQAGVTGEYFIDDVEIDTIVAPNPRTKQTNATKISFKVVEPYSMGIFLQTLQMAALRGGWKNYLDSPFLLQVEFIGWDDNGNPLNIPKSKRMFPLKLSNVEFNVTASGSEYVVEGIPWHETTFSDTVQATNTDTSVKGETVLELLQTGPESLATILNNRELEQVNAGNKAIGDHYVILFPTDRGAAARAAGSSGSGTAGATTQSTIDDVNQQRELTQERRDELAAALTGVQGGQIPEDFDAELSKLLGIVVSRSRIGEQIREFAEKPENVNEIGKALIAKSFLDSGKPYFGKPAFAEDRQNAPGIFRRGNITVSDLGRKIEFKQGTKIQDIIEEIVLLSEYARQLTTAPADASGMKNWFRIEADQYVIGDPSNVTKTGSTAKVYVFKVVPYKVHTSRLSAPTQAAPGIPQLRSQVMREYNYIYTGKNDDIIDFNIDIKAAFFSSVMGDFGQAGAGQKLQGSNATVAPPESPIHGASDGNTQSVPGAGTAPAVQVNGANTGNTGSGAQNHPENQVARSFNDAIVNSPVDLVTAELQIWGDPYYIADSGMGNYDAPQVASNITADGTMDYQNSEVDILINFRTPIDIGSDGIMKFPGGGSRPIGAFSGVYQVTTVKNSFSGNKFTQSLQTIRRRNQEVPGSVDIGLESVVEKGLDAIISPLASAPAAALAAAQDELSKALGGIGGIASASAALEQALQGATGDIQGAIQGGLQNASNALTSALGGSLPTAPTIPAQQTSDSISSRLTDVDQAGRIRGGL